MSYYVLRYDEEGVSAAGILDPPETPEFDDVTLDTGARESRRLPVIEFAKPTDDAGELLDCVTTMFRGWVISTKFREALEAARVDNIDYYPAKITDASSGRVHDNYWAANIVGLVSCMDRQKSKYASRAVSPDLVRNIDELHLDYSKIHGEKIFRLKEYFRLILVDETVKQAITDAQLRGVLLVPAEGYSM
jgi:uncharacterized protein DUF1629